jgi:uncharacterized membrane protein HdeD (DUF308 family)
MKVLKWLLPLAGLWIIALGVASIFTPLASLVTMATMLIFFGIGMVFSGISEVVSFFSAGKGNRSGMMLASGIMTTMFGIWVISGRGIHAIAIILPFVFAAWVMSSGITRISGAMPHKAEGTRFRFWQFVLGLITTVSGFALMFNPFMTAAVMLYIFPIMLISYGLGTIELFFRLRKAEKQNKGEV